MAKFFGALILTLNDLIGSMAIAIVIFAAFIAFILSSTIKTLVLDGKKTEVIQEDLEKYSGLVEKNKEAYSEKISKLFQRYNIVVFLPTLNFAARLIFGLFLIWGFSSEEVQALDPQLFGASFSLTGKALFAAQGISRTIIVLVGGFAIVEEYYLDRCIGSRLPYSQQVPDMISLIMLIVLVIFCPMAFSFYWVLISAIDHVLYKFYSTNKKQQEKLQQQLDDIISGKVQSPQQKKAKEKEVEITKKRNIKRLK